MLCFETDLHFDCARTNNGPAMQSQYGALVPSGCSFRIRMTHPSLRRSCEEDRSPVRRLREKRHDRFAIYSWQVWTLTLLSAITKRGHHLSHSPFMTFSAREDACKYTNAFDARWTMDIDGASQTAQWCQNYDSQRSFGCSLDAVVAQPDSCE